MSMVGTQQRQITQAARKLYEEKLRERLEREHAGEIIAVEPESGDYVLGQTLAEVDRACQDRFGARPVHVFRIGGGGAVKVGGRWRGRVS